MTAQPAAGSLAAAYRLPPLPDPPKKRDMQQSLHFYRPAVMNTVARHLDAMRDDATVVVAGEGYLCRHRSDLPSCPYPDMLIAFDVDSPAIIHTNGYVISEVGKPPDFVLEVASPTTGRQDYTVKRDIYARLGVTEYWRYDYSGGEYHDAVLAGDRLAGDVYRPVAITTEPDGVI